MGKGFTYESTHNESKEWYTPKYIFDALGVRFDLDPCSPGKNVVPWIPADVHLTIKDNGFAYTWFGNVFMNPPYGSNTPLWFKYLVQHGHGIGLVFVRSDTQWFHDYIPFADAICFIRGRVPFVRPEDAEAHARSGYSKGGCGAASMLVAFGQDNAKALIRSNLGFVMIPALRAEIKLPEMVSADGRFAGNRPSAPLATGCAYENPPRNVEPARSVPPMSRST